MLFEQLCLEVANREEHSEKPVWTVPSPRIRRSALSIIGGKSDVQYSERFDLRRRSIEKAPFYLRKRNTLVFPFRGIRATPIRISVDFRRPIH